MHSAMDTLFYQWATDDEDRSDPSLLEGIQNISLEEKVSTLQGVLAYLTTNLVEAQIIQTALVDEFVDKAIEDSELLGGVYEGELEEAISRIPEVSQASDDVEEASKDLDMFATSFTEAIVRGVEGYEV